MKYLEIKESDFFKTINKFTSPHLWKKTSLGFRLRHTANKDGTDD